MIKGYNIPQMSLFEEVKNPVLLDRERGRVLKEKGMQKAVTSADKDTPKWSVYAYKLLLEFLDQHHGEFMTEDVRSYAAMKEDFPLPPSARAWGSIIVKAKNNGLVKSIGTRAVKNVKAHQCYANYWVKS
jgi:hypothetical protein